MTELTDAAKRAKADYMRRWRQHNPGKHKENMIKYWNRRGEREAQQLQLETVESK